MKKYKNEQWLRREWKKKNRTQKDIGEECGVSDSTIYRWRKRHGITKPGASLNMQSRGYEQWKCEKGDSADTVLVHRLLATLQVDDLDELEGKHVHHKKNIPWLNTPENIEVVTPAEHVAIHTD